MNSFYQQLIQFLNGVFAAQVTSVWYLNYRMNAHKKAYKRDWARRKRQAVNAERAATMRTQFDSSDSDSDCRPLPDMLRQQSSSSCTVATSYPHSASSNASANSDRLSDSDDISSSDEELGCNRYGMQ